MKVSSSTNNSVKATDTTKSTKSATGKEASSLKSAAADAIADSTKVDLSSRAQDIKKAKELATPDNSIDEAKVARLQKLIDEGKYKTDAAAISDRLVDEHMMLPS